MLAMPRIAVLSLALLSALASATQAHAMDCDNDPPRAHDFSGQAGDVVQPQHLQMQRTFNGTGKLSVGICNADVRVLSRPSTTQLQVTVSIEGSHEAADYVQRFHVQPQDGVVELKFPKQAHARVTLTLPMKRTSDFELNLGKGDLDFNATGASGERRINVGIGSMKLVLDEQSYAAMQVNIGMGRLNDHRPGGQDGHFVISKAYQSTGSGEMQINIGMGSLDIRND